MKACFLIAECSLSYAKRETKMKKLIYFAAAFAFAAAVSTTTTGCRIPPPTDDGDTVAASEFEPEDTTAAHRQNTKTKAPATVKDSAGIYYIGEGSTKELLQLVSYPSRRDTLVYGKTRHVRVKGSADFGSIVRVKFYLLHGTDSLVSAVEQVQP